MPFYLHFAIKRDGAIELRYPWKAFGRFSINVAVMAIAVFAMKGLISGLPSLMGVSLTGGLIYLGLSHLNKGFEEHDRNLINQAIGKKLFVF